MRLARASDDFEWEDDDDEVTNFYDNDSSYDITCIEIKRINPPEFNIVDDIMVIGGNILEVDAYKYLWRYQTLSKEI